MSGLPERTNKDLAISVVALFGPTDDNTDYKVMDAVIELLDAKDAEIQERDKNFLSVTGTLRNEYNCLRHNYDDLKFDLQHLRSKMREVRDILNETTLPENFAGHRWAYLQQYLKSALTSLNELLEEK